jgi:hypothetical protein
MHRSFISAALAFLSVAVASVAAAAANTPVAASSGPTPVVVELYTSQGCSSCPPADALLGELARRKDVVALSFHVDYWDYIGWKDPFASAAATERQRDYGRALGLKMVYTPQIIVDGTADAVGSDQNAVEKLIAAAAKRPRVDIKFSLDEMGRLFVELPEHPLAGMATVWLAVFDSEHKTAVARGENSGATLSDYNVVRELRRVGNWPGTPVQLPVAMAPDAAAKHDGCAIIVQLGETGPILAAAIVPLKKGGW